MSRSRGPGYALVVLASATAVAAGVLGPVLPGWLAAWTFAVLVVTVVAAADRVAAHLLRDEPSPALRLTALGLVAGATAASVVTLSGCAGLFRAPLVLGAVAALHALAVRCLPEPRRW